jgi:hypothetical protein
MSGEASPHSGARLLTFAALVLMPVQASLGLVFPGEYRDPDWIRATWFGNDWVSLAVAFPLLTYSFTTAGRRSVRGLLLWLGTLGYAAYNYAFYVFGAALNVFFPLYVALLLTAGTALVVALARLDAVALSRSFAPTTRARAAGACLTIVGCGLAAVWMGLWAAYAFAARPTPVTPEAFKLVAALDLTIIAPLLISGGVLLYRRRPWGYVLAPIAALQGALYLVVLTVNSVIAIQRGLAEAPGEAPLWGGLGFVTGAAAVSLLASAGGEVRSDRANFPRGSPHI